MAQGQPKGEDFKTFNKTIFGNPSRSPIVASNRPGVLRRQRAAPRKMTAPTPTATVPTTTARPIMPSEQLFVLDANDAPSTSFHALLDEFLQLQRILIVLLQTQE